MKRHDRTLKRVRETNANVFPSSLKRTGIKDIKVLSVANLRSLASQRLHHIYAGRA
jgi:hypothetical protein